MFISMLVTLGCNVTREISCMSQMPKPRCDRTTIQDVADAAGVSTSSVSNYLNGRLRHMRPETSERIRKSILALQYSPSAAARQLKTGHTPLIGLLIPSVLNPYHAELALALDAASQGKGYRVVIGNGNREAGRERSFVEELVGYGVRGIIATSELRDPEVVRDYAKLGVAFVLFDLSKSEAMLDCVDLVSIDNEMATAIAVDHLVALGHRRIAFVTTAPVSANRFARQRGYEAASRRHGLGKPNIVDHDGGRKVERDGESRLAHYGQRAAGQILRLKPRPTGVVALNDIMAIGLMAGLHHVGVDVPKDISVVGIDDTQLSRLVVPSLTTLRPDYAGMADQAVGYLHTRLVDLDQPCRETIFAPKLIARESTAVVCEPARNRAMLSALDEQPASRRGSPPAGE